MRAGGDGATTAFVCGYLTCDPLLCGPILESLPPSCRRRHADEGNVDRRPECADRLLLRLPDGLNRSDANSDMTADPAEINVIRQQFARLHRSAVRTHRSTGRSRWRTSPRAGGRRRAPDGRRPADTTMCATRGTTTCKTTTRGADSCWLATRRARSSSRSSFDRRSTASRSRRGSCRRSCSERRWRCRAARTSAARFSTCRSAARRLRPAA